MTGHGGGREEGGPPGLPEGRPAWTEEVAPSDHTAKRLCHHPGCEILAGSSGGTG
jgi:hypothetical protein